jgi:hypothetical protein
LQRIGFLWPPFPCPLGDWDPRHSFDNPGPTNVTSLAHPLVVLPSLRSLTGGGRQDSRTRPDTSPGVRSPSAHAGSGQLVLLELPTFSLLACEVSHLCTPSTPSRSDPALFHAGGALGVAPFRALIIRKVRTSLEVGYPLVGPFSAWLLPLVEPVPFRRPCPCGHGRRSEECRGHAWSFDRAWTTGTTVSAKSRCQFEGAAPRRVVIPRFQRNGTWVVPCLGCRKEQGKPSTGFCSLLDAVPMGRGLADPLADAPLGFRLFTGFPPGVVGLLSQASPPRALPN